ncbi:PucR family transcriptional regulator [Citricoccus sp. SGAir0253]|uniref:PucR family transcriptional regulator ligand-binding domain-containing protein n=1 Tax=Citricoccus sp. SGAir0253 TaxID=2567881 RepID=UPI00110770A2|nr:PucR family transcriptional regulator ligand-binding domain-containing protein [Citricoccus sp. SGAir0253]QCU77015.1 PucR family transcriptional regulator [Citricoccus sp. SGAir0253]
MVSLLELSTELGPHLVPVGGRPPSSRQLSGVHISELEDPTPFLDGGELLLTTGMPLGGNEATTAAYVERLRAIGLPALGIGLGPWLEQVPAHLVETCAAAGIELLSVPHAVPFQSVSRAFWGLTARSGQADLMNSLGTQTALARAAMRPEATPAVVRGIAQALGGWAAYLPVDPGPETYWPAQTEAWLPVLRSETQRLHRAGAHSVATFELHGQPVVEYPIASGDRIHGFLAIGPGRALTAADRQVIVTVCILLAIKARQREALAGTTAALGAVVAKLLLRGQAEAARLLAEDLGLHDLPPRVRVLGLRMQPGDDAGLLVRAAPALAREEGLPPLGSAVAECLLRHEEGGVLHLVLPADLGPASGGERTAPGGGGRDGGRDGGREGSQGGADVVPLLEDIPAAWPAPWGTRSPWTRWPGRCRRCARRCARPRRARSSAPAARTRRRRRRGCGPWRTTPAPTWWAP